MITFDIGDRVEVREDAGPYYSITSPGSYGIVVDLREGGYNSVYVKFQYITSDKQHCVGDTFPISNNSLKLKPYTKLEKALL